MKKNIIPKSLCALSFSLCTLIYAQSSLAEHDIQSLYSKTYNASNTCFPRTFSQIDQFKVSSGGLRNIHPNPRSIICSINSESSQRLYPDRVDESGRVIFPEGASITVNFSALPAEMPCTAYTRNKETAAVITSHSRVFPAGSTSGIVNFGDPYGLQWGTSYPDSYTYLQCRVPGGGRIISFTANFYYLDEA